MLKRSNILTMCALTAMSAIIMSGAANAQAVSLNAKAADGLCVGEDHEPIGENSTLHGFLPWFLDSTSSISTPLVDGPSGKQYLALICTRTNSSPNLTIEIEGTNGDRSLVRGKCFHYEINGNSRIKISAGPGTSGPAGGCYKIIR